MTLHGTAWLRGCGFVGGGRRGGHHASRGRDPSLPLSGDGLRAERAQRPLAGPGPAPCHLHAAAALSRTGRHAYIAVTRSRGRRRQRLWDWIRCCPGKHGNLLTAIESWCSVINVTRESCPCPPPPPPPLPFLDYPAGFCPPPPPSSASLHVRSVCGCGGAQACREQVFCLCARCVAVGNWFHSPPLPPARARASGCGFEFEARRTAGLLHVYCPIIRPALGPKRGQAREQPGSGGRAGPGSCLRG